MNAQRTGVLLDRSTVSKARRNAKLELHEDGVLTGWRRARLNSADEEQLRALATVLPELEKRGIALYTYDELLAEGMLAAIPLGWHPAGDLLREVQLKHVRAPIARGKVMGPLTLDQFASRDNVITFVERLLENTPFWPEMEQNFSDFEKANAANRGRMRELCKGLSSSQYPDALHLWAAEVNDLKYFLTMDKKFCNVMTKPKPRPLPCEPVRPLDLMSKLRVSSFVPFHVLDDGDWHHFGEGHP